MRIPVYNREVSVNPTLTSGGPDIPMPNESSSGVNVAKAQERAGLQAQQDITSLGTNVASHIAQRQAQNEEILKDSYINKFKQETQESQYDQTPEDYTDALGQTKQRPKGIMLQVGDQTAGAFKRARESINDRINKTALSISDARVRTKFLSEAAGYKTSFENTALSHEASQYRLHAAKEVVNTISNLIDESRTIPDVDTANAMLKRVSEKSGLLSDTQGDDSATRQKVLDDNIQKTAEAIVIGKLKATNGDMDSARLMLDGIQLPQAAHDYIAEKIVSVGKTINEQQKYQAKTAEIANRFGLVQDIVLGKENIAELSPQAQAIVDSDTTLSAAINKATKSKSTYYTEDKAAEDLIKTFSDASSITDRDAMSSLAADLITRGGELNADKLGLVLFYAQKRAEILGFASRDLNAIDATTTQAQIEGLKLDASFNRINQWAKEWGLDTKNHSQAVSEFMTKVKNGEKPLDALISTVNSTNLRLHPAMVNYPKEGQLLRDAKGNLKIAFPTGEFKPVVPVVKKASAKQDNGSTAKETNNSGDISFEELKRK